MPESNVVFNQLLQSLFPGHANTLSLDSNFLRHGGDSLLAAEMAAGIYKSWGVRIAVRQIIQAPDFACLLAQLPAYTAPPLIEPAAALRAQLGQAFKQCPAQIMIYLEHFRQPRTTAYNIPVIAAIPSAISLKRFYDALQQVAHRFPVLFAQFYDNEGEYYFRVDQLAEIAIERFSSLEQAAQQFVRPFSLQQPPLLRAGLIPFDGKQTHLLLDFSHIVADGVSLGHVITQLKQALIGGLPNAETDTMFSFCNWRTSPAYQQQHAADEPFWRETLQAIGPKPRWPGLLTQRNAVPHSAAFGYGMVQGHIDGELALALKTLAERHQTTPFVLMLLAFFLLQAELTEEWQSQVGVVVSGRTEPAWFDCVGMFVNTLILPLTLKRDTRVQDALAMVSERALAALEHQTWPMARQLQQIGIKSADQSHPLLDALFAFQNISYQKLDVLGGRFRSFHEAKTMAQFGMVIHVFDLGPQGYDIQWEFCPRHIAQGTISTFLGMLTTICQQLAQSKPDACLAQLCRQPNQNKVSAVPEAVMDFDFGD